MQIPGTARKLLVANSQFHCSSKALFARSYNETVKVSAFGVGCVPVNPGVHPFQDKHRASPAFISITLASTSPSFLPSWLSTTQYWHYLWQCRYLDERLFGAVETTSKKHSVRNRQYSDSLFCPLLSQSRQQSSPILGTAPPSRGEALTLDMDC